MGSGGGQDCRIAATSQLRSWQGQQHGDGSEMASSKETRALARLEDLESGTHLIRDIDIVRMMGLLKALLEERYARYHTLGHEEDSAKAATERRLRAFLE